MAYTYVLSKVKRTVDGQKIVDVADLDGAILLGAVKSTEGGRKKLSLSGRSANNAAIEVDLEYVDPEDDHSPQFVPDSGVGGSVNAIELSPERVHSSLAAGDAFIFKAGGTSTGPVTCQINDVTAVQVHLGGAQADAGSIIDGQLYELRYDGTQLQITGLQLGTAASKNTGTDEGDVPVIGSGGTIDEDVLPSIPDGNIADLDVPAAGTDDETYVVRRRSADEGGGLDIVGAVFRRWVDIAVSAQRTVAWSVPHTGRYRFEVQGGRAGEDGGSIQCPGNEVAGGEGDAGRDSSVNPGGDFPGAVSNGAPAGSPHIVPTKVAVTYSLSQGHSVTIKAGGGGAGGSGGYCAATDEQGLDGDAGASGFVKVWRVG